MAPPPGSAEPNAQPRTCTLDFHPTETWNSVPQSSTDTCGSFDVQRYFSALETATLGRVLFSAGTTPSTQTIIQINVAKLPDGVLFVADRQMGGKGRGGNVWESPAGCLMFTTCSRLTIAGQSLPFVQYLVTLAVVQAVQAEAVALLGCKERSPLDIRIKWPNDVYAGGLKLGGILCHSSFRDGQFHVVMGVGLNLANRTPTTCVDAILQADGARRGVAATQSLVVCKETLLARAMNRLEPMLRRLASDGFGPFEKDYYAAWLHSGQVVVLDESVNGVREQVQVAVMGLSPHGYLMAEDGAGQRYELHPDGNSLDFFKGLIRKKLP